MQSLLYRFEDFVKKNPADDEHPAEERKCLRQHTHRYIINRMLNPKALPLGNEGSDGLLSQGFQNVLVIFKRKKKDNKPPHDQDFTSGGLIQRYDQSNNNADRVENRFKIMNEDKVYGV